MHKGSKSSTPKHFEELVAIIKFVCPWKQYGKKINIRIEIVIVIVKQA